MDDANVAIWLEKKDKEIARLKGALKEIVALDDYKNLATDAEDFNKIQDIATSALDTETASG